MADIEKILIYMPSFAGGGGERNGVLIASELARRGYQVRVAVDSTDGPNRGLLDGRVLVHGLAQGRHAADVGALRRLMGSWRPDFVVTHLGIAPFKCLLAALGVIAWRRIMIIYNNPYEPAAPRGVRMTYRSAAVLTRVAGATIAVSQDVKMQLVGHYAARDRDVAVIHNPVDIAWIRRNSLESNHDPLRGRRYVLSVGRLIAQKDFRTLIRAYARIHGAIEHDLVILGEGNLRESLERLTAELGLADRVHLPGYLANPFPVYRGAAVFALSSVYEGFGNVLVEAMALGVPVVATRCPGGPREILADGKFGRLVPAGDPDALAGAILETLAAPLPKKTLQDRAADFSVARVVDAYLGAARSAVAAI